MESRKGAVYLQTNDGSANEVIASRRGEDGELEPRGRFSTGGRGTGVPHLTSQGSVVLSQNGARLLVANSGSDDVSLFRILEGAIELVDRVDSGGSAPRSVAERDGLVYVLNTGERANVSGFRIDGDALVPMTGSTRRLSVPGADPAQVGFSPDGSTLVVTERATDSIVTYAVGADGALADPQANPSSGPTPYGFAFADGGTLVVTETFGAQVGKAAASSYRLERGEVTARTRSLGNGRSEICWALVTNDGRWTHGRRPLPLRGRRGRAARLRLGRRRRRLALADRLVGRVAGDGRGAGRELTVAS